MEHGHFLASRHGLGKLVRRHIGPTPRPVDSEESQADGSQFVRAAVVMGEQLVCLLRRGVHVAGTIRVGGQAERDRSVFAIHTRTGRVDQLDVLFKN